MRRARQLKLQLVLFLWLFPVLTSVVSFLCLVLGCATSIASATGNIGYRDRW
jgi:hypothetical protein